MYTIVSFVDYTNYWSLGLSRIQGWIYTGYIVYLELGLRLGGVDWRGRINPGVQGKTFLSEN